MVKQKTGVKANTLFTADNLYILNGMNSESVFDINSCFLITTGFFNHH